MTGIWNAITVPKMIVQNKMNVLNVIKFAPILDQDLVTPEVIKIRILRSKLAQPRRLLAMVNDIGE